MFLCFAFHRHVTHSAELYSLIVPFVVVVVVLQTCNAQCSAVQSHCSLFSFSFSFFLSFLQTCHAQCWALQYHCSCFFLPFFFTDMSRTVLGCSIAAAAVMLACLISLMCGVWPARCDPLKKPRLYLATSILLLLASESSASVPFCSRRYPSARKTPYTLHSVLDVFRTFPFKLFQLVTWASE